LLGFDSDMKRVNTKTISSAMYQVAKDIQGGDGVANAACIEAAIRLDELNMALLAIKNATSKGEMRCIALQATGSNDDS
jgi:hypothetical protein